MGWTCPHQSLRECSAGLPTDQFKGGIFSSETPSTDDSSLCRVDIKPASTTTEKVSRQVIVLLIYVCCPLPTMQINTLLQNENLKQVTHSRLMTGRLCMPLGKFLLCRAFKRRSFLNIPATGEGHPLRAETFISSTVS